MIIKYEYLWLILHPLQARVKDKQKLNHGSQNTQNI